MLTKQALILLLVLVSWHIPQAMGQDEFQVPTASQIRARKLAKQWQGNRIEVRLTNGKATKGKLIDATFSSITIKRWGKKVVLPLEKIESVILPAGLPELVMVGITASLGGALGYGMASLAHPDTEDWVAQTSAGVGGLVLGYWGFRIFYQDIRYDLREE